MWYNDNWWMSSSPTSSNNPSCTNAIMMEVLTGVIGWIPHKYLALNESVTTFSGLVRMKAYNRILIKAFLIRLRVYTLRIIQLYFKNLVMKM